MDEPGDVAQTGGRLDERTHSGARGRVHCRDAHLVSGVPQDLCCRLSVFVAHVGQQDVLTKANPAGNRLADLTRPDDDYDLFHDYSSRERAACLSCVGAARLAGTTTSMAFWTFMTHG